MSIGLLFYLSPHQLYAAGLSNPKGILNGNHMIKTDNQKDLDVYLTKNKRVLALFYATWCYYCSRFVPVFDNATAGLKASAVIHVIVDDYDSPLWDDYSIGAVPTVILFEDGEVRSRLDGRFGSGLSETQFKTWLAKNNP
jgi:thioredoxin 1